MIPQPKKPRPFGRLPQCNKRVRLTRRFYGQWKAATDEQLPNRLKELVP